MSQLITLEEFEAELDKMKSTIFGRMRLKSRYIRRKIIGVFDIPYHLKRIKWFIQRGKRGWADCDWWSMNYHLVGIIVPMLKTLKEKSMTYPGCKGASTPEEWNTVLDTMIEGFEAAKRVIDDDYCSIVSPGFPEKKATRKEVMQWVKMNKEDQKIFKKKSKLFIKWFFDLWD